MPPTKVYILYRKDKPDDAIKIEEIKKSALTAGQMLNKPVEVEFSTNFRQFENLSVNMAMTPIVVINNISEFAGSVPTVDQMKKCLLSSASASDMF